MASLKKHVNKAVHGCQLGLHPKAARPSSTLAYWRGCHKDVILNNRLWNSVLDYATFKSPRRTPILSSGQLSRILPVLLPVAFHSKACLLYCGKTPHSTRERVPNSLETRKTRCEGTGPACGWRKPYSSFIIQTYKVFAARSEEQLENFGCKQDQVHRRLFRTSSRRCLIAR